MNRRLLILIEVVATLLIIGAVWVFSLNTGSVYFPSLDKVFVRFQEVWLFDRFFSDLVPSLLRLAAGFSLALILGVAGGIAIGYSRVLSLLTDPLVTFLRSVPPPALLPFFLAVMGTGDSMRIALITFVCAWPILLNTSDGVHELDQTLVSTVRLFRIGGLERLRFVVLPALGPRIFAGARTSLAIGLVIMIVSEMFASRNGVGYVVLEAQATFQITTMWAGIVMLGLLGYLLNAALGQVESRNLRWYLKSNR